MFHNAKNGVIHLENSKIEYIRFGNGNKTLVMLPGLGDSLRSLKGMAVPMAMMYRRFAKDYTVYMFGRRNNMPAGYSTLDMSKDLRFVMDSLGIKKASIIGVSMGGMIAQHFTADYPERVSKLVLVVTSAKPNPVLNEAVNEWIDIAKRGDHRALMDSNLKRIYSDAYYRRNKWAIPIVGALTKPKSYENFIIQAQACLNHNAYDKLSLIHAPTLVMGGRQDKTLGGEASEEIAELITDSMLIMHDEYGHGLYDEYDDFQNKINRFLSSN